MTWFLYAFDLLWCGSFAISGALVPGEIHGSVRVLSSPSSTSLGGGTLGTPFLIIIPVSDQERQRTPTFWWSVLAAVATTSGFAYPAESNENRAC